MSKLVLITGLQRGNPIHYDLTTASGIFVSGSDSVAGVHGFRVKSALGRQYSYDSAAVAASTATLSGVGGDDFTGYIDWAANYPGTYGNNISVGLTTSGSGNAITISTSWAATTGYPTFTVTCPPSTLVWQVVAAVNSDEEASQFINASTLTPTNTAGGFAPLALVGGTNGTKLDAEPPYNVAGEPIWINVTDRVTVVVDIQDRVVQRTLQRNRWRYVSLGAIEAVSLT